MPIEGVSQPEYLFIDPTLRLRRYDGEQAFALSWYQDPETLWLVDRDPTPYTPERLSRMYAYLETRGELYWIESYENGGWRPIGDVTFWQEDMPIVIGDPACRGRGIGRRVIAALVERGRQLEYAALAVREIYEDNLASRACFEAVGFRSAEKTEQGHRYRMEL